MRRFIPLCLIILALTARLIPGPRIIDDSYITYRYSRNILAGNGFVFNPGERVLGTTTPLYTLILTGVGAISGGSQAPFPIISWLLNAAFDAASCILLWQLGKRLVSERIGLITAVVWAVAAYSVTFSIGGLETSLFVFLFLLTSLSYLNNQTYLIWLCASLLILTRPDALIFLGPLFFLTLLSSDREKVLKIFPVLLAAIPLITWLIFGFIYFGNPIPHSLAAKSVAYHLLVDAAFQRLLQHYLTPFTDQYTLGQRMIYLNIILYPLLFIIGSYSIVKKSSKSLALIIYPILYFLTFSIIHPLIFRWYLTPPMPFYFLTLLAGAELILDRLVNSIMKGYAHFIIKPSEHNHLVFTSIATLILLIPIFFSIRGWVIKPDHGNPTPAPEMAWIKLEELYKQASADIVSFSPPNSVVAAGDVGVLGYFTNRTILDTVGLNSPISTDYYPLPASDYVINYAIPTKLILDQKPDLVVFLEVYARHTLMQSADFLSSYHLLKRYDTNLYGSDGLLIYQRGE